MSKNNHNTKTNKEWFKQRLDANKKSQGDLARFMEMDPGQLSRTLSGGRKMQAKEAEQIARFLQAPVAEVIKHAGIAIDEQGGPTSILLAATVDEHGNVHRLKEPRPLPPGVIARAQAACGIDLTTSANIIAAQIRAIEGPLAQFDDVVVLFRATNAVEGSAIGVLSICRTYDGDQVMGKIERARKTGEARVICANGKAKEFLLQTAAPIIALIP